MKEYHNLVKSILHNGQYRENRTAVDTVSSFHESYTIDVSDGFPLLTTKQMSDYRWNSLIHELLWYFSGEHHIRDLREETKIWNAWADDDWNLPSAYGRFWRRYPVPEQSSQLPGEAWVGEGCKWVSEENDTLVFDQLQYIIDTLNGDNPDRTPNSRRLVVNAWHPANADSSSLPPCHFSYQFNVQGEKLNLALYQRSGDVALGIPFNIAAYSLILNIIAQQTGYQVGEFGHTIGDAHLYSGKGERGKWYNNNLSEVRERFNSETNPSVVADWIEEQAPKEETKGYDHIPGLLRQLSRDPLTRPSIEITDKPIDQLEFDDIQLNEYEHHDSINFEVAE